MTKQEYLRQEKGMTLQHVSLKRRANKHMLWHLRHKPYSGCVMNRGDTIENDKSAPGQFSKIKTGNTNP